MKQKFSWKKIGFIAALLIVGSFFGLFFNVQVQAKPPADPSKEDGLCKHITVSPRIPPIPTAFTFDFAVDSPKTYCFYPNGFVFKVTPDKPLFFKVISDEVGNGQNTGKISYAIKVKLEKLLSYDGKVQPEELELANSTLPNGVYVSNRDMYSASVSSIGLVRVADKNADCAASKGLVNKAIGIVPVTLVLPIPPITTFDKWGDCTKIISGPTYTKLDGPEIWKVGEEREIVAKDLPVKQFIGNVTTTGDPILKEYEIYTHLDLTSTIPTSENVSLTGAQALKIGFKVYKDKASLEADTSPLPPGYENQEQGVTQSGEKKGSVASGIGEFITKIFTIIILLITRLLYYLFAFVLAPLLESLLSIRTYTDTFVGVIYPGWQIIRNICNIIFIVALLAIGLGTLFRVEQYNYKHLLVKVIIAAFLVNFSLVFGQAILGVADTLQGQFLPNNTSVIRALGRELMVRPIQTLTDSQYYSGGNTDINAGASFSNIAIPALCWWLALAAFFTFLILVGFLIIRLVALWILLLVSPLAYVANIFPQTSSFTSQWWQKFMRYAFVTPVLGFFLNIAALFATSHVISSSSGLVPVPNVKDDIQSFVFLTLSHMLIILFMLIGLKAAASSGTYAADKITGFAEKGVGALSVGAAAGAAGLAAKGAWSGVKSGADYGAQQLHAKTGIQLDPRVWKKEWKDSSERARAERQRQGNKIFHPRDFIDNNLSYSGLKRGLTTLTKGGHAAHVQSKTAAETQLKNYQEGKQVHDSVLTDEQRQSKHDEMDDETVKLGEQQKKARDAEQKLALLQEEAAKKEEELEKQVKKKEEAVKQARSVYPAGHKVPEELEKQLYLKQRELLEAKAEAKKVITPLQEEVDQSKKDLVDQEKKVSGLTDELAQDRELRFKYHIEFYSDQDKQNLQNQLAEIERQTFKDEKGNTYSGSQALEARIAYHKKYASKTKPPEPYYAKQAELQAVAEEKKKLSDNIEELYDDYEEAVQQGKDSRAQAILERVAEAGKFGALLKRQGHEVSGKGARQFLDKHAQQFGISERRKYEIAADISSRNQKNDLYNLSNLTEYDNGKLGYIKDEGKRNENIFNSISSQEPRNIIRKTPLSGYVHEVRDSNGQIQDRIYGAGLRTLKEIDKPEYRGYLKDMPRYTRENIVKAGNWSEVKKGLSSALVDFLETGQAPQPAVAATT